MRTAGINLSQALKWCPHVRACSVENYCSVETVEKQKAGPGFPLLFAMHSGKAPSEDSCTFSTEYSNLCSPLMAWIVLYYLKGSQV